MPKKPLHFLLAKENKTLDEPSGRFGGSLEVGEVKKFVDSSYMPNKTGIQQIGNYVLDKELSTNKAKVYHDPTTNKTVVANRGTTGTVSDWANNARYLMGTYNESDRMKQAEKVQKKAIQKYGKVDTNVGHSQGGIITRRLNEEGLTNEVINLNPASKGEKVQKNEFVIKSALDPVSILQKEPKKRTTKTKGTWNFIKEHSTDILNRLDPTQLIGVGNQGSPTTPPYDEGKGFNNMLTDSDIDAYMHKLKIKDYHGCYIKDELPNLPEGSSRVIGNVVPYELNKGFYVINLNGQSHWTCLYKDIDEYGNNSYLYFDSFGFPAPTEVEQAIKRDNMGRNTNYFSMENQLQDITHTSCGFYVIGWCKFLNLKKDKIKAYQDFIKKFTNDPSQNDVILKKMIKLF